MQPSQGPSGLAASAHLRESGRKLEDFERRAKSAGPFSALRQGAGGRGQSRGRQNLDAQAARWCLPDRWRSTGGRQNCPRRPGKPTAWQAGCSCRNSPGDLRIEWEQAPGAAGSKAWSAGLVGNSSTRLRGSRSGSRAGASAPSGHGISNHDRKRTASPGQPRPIGR
jgi:hypothetical protein